MLPKKPRRRFPQQGILGRRASIKESEACKKDLVRTFWKISVSRDTKRVARAEKGGRGSGRQ